MARQKRGADLAERFPAARPTKKTPSKTSRRKAPNASSAKASQPLSLKTSHSKARKIPCPPRSRSSENADYNFDSYDAANNNDALSSSSSDDSILECTLASSQTPASQRSDSRLPQSYPTVVNRRLTYTPSTVFPSLGQSNAESHTRSGKLSSLSAILSTQSTSQPGSARQTRSSAANAEAVTNREYFAVTYLVRNGPVNNMLIERGKVLLEELFAGCDVDPTTTSMVSLDD